MESGSEIERGGGAKDRIDQIEVVMPKVGLTMTEAVIVQWHKRAGDWVAKGELLFTFETEKSTLDYESPAAGILAHILVPAGDSAVCYAPVAVLGPAGSAPPPSAQPREAVPAMSASPASPASAAARRHVGVSYSMP
jgi:pyruvate dehydrogenase E2 component (dihydrolipoamide acetyltransferase)